MQSFYIDPLAGAKMLDMCKFSGRCEEEKTIGAVCHLSDRGI